MKTFTLTFFIVVALQFAGISQNITGIWRGYFISDMGEKYKLEFQIDNSTAFSKGVSYSYLDVRFYGKATMTGSFSKSNQTLKIREIKTVEVKNLTGGGACIMNYNLTYSKLGKEEFLEGTYLGKQEVLTGENPYKWGDCGGGKVFLRRVVNSDFYVEPFLKGKVNTKPIIINQVPEKKDTSKSNTAITKPANQLVIINKPPVKKAPPVTATNPKLKPVTSIPIKKDTVKNKIEPPVVKLPVVKPPKPQILKTRINELVKTLTVSSQDVVVKFYDNGEIDDDTISVYYDNRPVLTSKKLTASPLTIKLKLDDDGEAHELTMVADNLGRIPPNTSLMIVEAGEQRFEVRITSTEQKNAVVRFTYQKPN